MGRRVLLIWNPVSTEVTAESVGSVLVQMAARLEVVSMHTRGSRDAERLGGLAVEQGFDAVFVLGGDGTANEVINGVGDRLPVGVLPAGGTSVLPRVLGLPRVLDEAVERLCDALDEGSVRPIALGTVNGRRFSFAAGIGIDAEIVKRIDERGRGGEAADEAARPGDLWFVREAVAALLEGEYASPLMRVEVPGQGELPAATAFVANCSPWSFAGPVPLDVAPDATFEGGLNLVRASRSSRIRRRAGSPPSCARRTTSIPIVCSGSTTSGGRPFAVNGRFPCRSTGSLGEYDRIELGVVRDAARLLV